jgi:Concanavalin A-like lectin/glucanases superfamily/Fibronectin type III domain
MTVLSLRRHSRGLGLSPRRARHGSGEQAGDIQAPTVPQNLVATAVSSSQINLTWTASTDNVAVTGYNIYRDNVLVDTSPTNSYADTGLAPGTEYDYEVSAFDAASNESARSAPASATTHQVIVTAGLIAEWRFDEGAGQVVTDHSGHGNHLQLGSTAGVDLGEPTWASYGIDCVLNASENHLRANAAIGIAGTQARTVIGVVQIDTNFGANNTGCSFFTWIGSGGTGTRWTLRNESGDPTLRMESGGGGNNSQSFTGLDFSDETWSFVAATQSGAATNTAVAYKDGASAPYTNVGTPINTAGALVVMGQEAAASGTGRWGKIAYGLVYNRALSPAEVEQNRQALKAILAGRGIALP